MIQIAINTNKEKVLDSLVHKDTTLQEVSVVMFRLEQIKNKLLELDFESELEVKKDE